MSGWMWELIVVLLLFCSGYAAGMSEAFDGDNTDWYCTAWEDKPNSDCTQYTRKEPER